MLISPVVANPKGLVVIGGRACGPCGKRHTVAKVKEPGQRATERRRLMTTSGRDEG